MFRVYEKDKWEFEAFRQARFIGMFMIEMGSERPEGDYFCITSEAIYVGCCTTQA